MTSTPIERPTLAESLKADLINLKIPLSTESPCNGCASNEGEGDEEEEEEHGMSYPKGWEIDLTSDLLGSIKDYGRQILISTSNNGNDWTKEVTDDKETLAGLINTTFLKLGDPNVDPHAEVEGPGRTINGIPGVYPSFPSHSSTSTTTLSLDSLKIEPSTTNHNENEEQSPLLRLSVLNSSFNSSSHNHNHQSVIVLPDYKIIMEVPETKEAAEELVENYLEEKIGRCGVGSDKKGSLKSWPLPYLAVVLVCSHKKRDKRCYQAAPLLVAQFHRHLEHHGLEVDERGDGPDLHHGEPIENWSEPKDIRMEETLKGVKKSGTGTVGVFKVSHVGGHKFAGNIIIYLPNGACVWYGRVTPRDIKAIVEETILKGKIIPDLLRGALGVTGKDKEEGILSW